MPFFTFDTEPQNNAQKTDFPVKVNQKMHRYLEYLEKFCFIMNGVFKMFNKFLRNNNKIISLLKKYNKPNPPNEICNKIVKEIFKGSFDLFVPVNMKSYKGNYAISNLNNINSANIFIKDGLRILFAFTDEKSFSEWAGDNNICQKINSETLIRESQNSHISKFIINPDSSLKFEIERDDSSFENINREEYFYCEYIELQQSVNKSFIEALIFAFKANDNIKEVYLYSTKTDLDCSVSLAFKLYVNSDDAKNAVKHSIINLLEEKGHDFILDLCFIEDDEWHEYVKSINNSLVYEKCLQNNMN